MNTRLFGMGGRHLAGAAVVSVCAALAAACGGGGSSSLASSSGGGGSAAKTISLTATDSGFSPSTVTLPKPGTYTFQLTNKGTRAYSVDVEGNLVDKDATPAKPGGTTQLTVHVGAGTYTIHSQDDGEDRAHEIKATLVVQGS